MRFLEMAVIVGLAGFSFSAAAGKFICVASPGGIGCPEIIKDIVTDKFTNKFPASKYAIHVTYIFNTYSDGGGVGFSIAGVVPRNNSKNWEFLPDNRFISTTRINAGISMSADDVKIEERDLIRRSVTRLMEDCDRSPSCDVLLFK